MIDLCYPVGSVYCLLSYSRFPYFLLAYLIPSCISICLAVYAPCDYSAVCSMHICILLYSLYWAMWLTASLCLFFSSLLFLSASLVPSLHSGFSSYIFILAHSFLFFVSCLTLSCCWFPGSNQLCSTQWACVLSKLPSFVMFFVRVSPIALLQDIAARCRLPFVSLVHEVGTDGVYLYGVEFELPALFPGGNPRRLFFWSSTKPASGTPYDQAAFDAVSYLQSIYGFVVVDYSFQRLLSYAMVARNALSVTSDAVRLASTIVQDRENGRAVGPHLLAQAQNLLQSTGFVQTHV